MVLDLPAGQWRAVQPPLSLAWLALALALGALGAMLALVTGPAVGLLPALLALGVTVGILVHEVETRKVEVRWQSI